MSIDAAQFKAVMSRWGSGVTVITMKSGEVVHGMTASAFCSVSLEPPLCLVCVGKKQGSHKILKDAGRFVINLLAEEQASVSDYFAKPRPDGKAQFDSIPHGTTANGEPTLSGALAHLECTLHSVAEAGDHDIFVGKIEKVEINERIELPLIYYKGKYRKLAAI
jgi:flavin reductase (DIM6/NTAB) family NADH-FMN oxidoreductase RutF